MSTDAPTPNMFGKYELLGKIGVGGMAEIYRARVEGPGGFEKILVLKKILPAFAKNRAFIKMLIAEAKVSSVLHHANIVQIYELGEIDGQYYIAMEYVHGADLLRILTECSSNGERLPEEVVIFILGEVCRGVAHAHSAVDLRGHPLNIIHRDISPSNVLVSFEGETKVMDFGVARADTDQTTPSGHGSQRGVLKGKLGYVSPELVEREDIDQRADIFALGILLFESLTLKRLFVGKNDMETLVNIREARIDEKLARHSYLSEGIQVILRKALARDRQDRYQSASEFQEALIDYLFENRLRVSSNTVASWMLKLFPASETGQPHYGDPGPVSSEEDNPETRPTRKGGEESSAAEMTPPRGTELSRPPKTAALAPTSEPVADLVQEDVAAAAEAAVELVAEGGEADDPVARATKRLGGSTFYLKGPDGSPLGPLNLVSLTNLLQERVISGREQVRVDDQPWASIGELPDVASLCAVLLHDEVDPQYEGDLDRLKMPNLLYRMTVNRANGTLRFTNGKTYKELVFQKGALVYINSNIHSELLGEFMIARRLIRLKDVNEAISLSREQGIRFGDALIRLGRVQPHELFRILEVQYQEKFLETFRWASGRYQFFAGVISTEDMIWMSHDTIQLIIEAIRTEYELPTLRRALHAHFDGSIVLMKNPHITHNNLRLNPREMRFYTRLDEGMILRQVFRRLGRTDADYLSLLQVIFALEQTELLTFTDRDPSRGRPG